MARRKKGLLLNTERTLHSKLSKDIEFESQFKKKAAILRFTLCFSDLTFKFALVLALAPAQKKGSFTGKGMGKGMDKGMEETESKMSSKVWKPRNTEQLQKMISKRRQKLRYIRDPLCNGHPGSCNLH